MVEGVAVGRVFADEGGAGVFQLVVEYAHGVAEGVGHRFVAAAEECYLVSFQVKSLCAVDKVEPVVFEFAVAPG